MSTDPRDNGFNYAGGWPSDLPKPPIYNAAVALATLSRAAASAVTAWSWDLDMAIRDVRLASTEHERQAAVDRLTAMIQK